MKELKLLKNILAGVVLFSQLSGGNALAEVPIPSQLMPFYNSSSNPLLSDSFNGASLDETKWQYRWASNGQFGQKNQRFIPLGQPGVDKKYVEIESDNNNNRYVSIRGSHTEEKGSGITTISPIKYGFYTARWSVDNIKDNGPSRWHPAIWAAGCDFAMPRTCNTEVDNKRPRIELDPMEGFQQRDRSYWTSHLITWKNNADGSSKSKKYPLTARSYVWPEADKNEWQTIGFEYNPEYVRLWSYDESEGWSIVKTRRFIGGPSNLSAMNDEHRATIYWILSNKWYGTPAGEQDSALNIDFFYSYDHVGGSYFNGDSTPVNGVTYKLKNAHSNTFLTLEEGAAVNSEVQLRDERSDDTTQKWVFLKPNGSAFWNIKSAHSSRYLRCYQDGSAANDKNIVVHGRAEKSWATVKWSPINVGSGFVIRCAYKDQNMRGYDPLSLPNSGDGAAVTMLKPYRSAWSTFKWVLVDTND